MKPIPQVIAQAAQGAELIDNETAKPVETGPEGEVPLGPPELDFAALVVATSDDCDCVLDVDEASWDEVPELVVEDTEDGSGLGVGDE